VSDRTDIPLTKIVLVGIVPAEREGHDKMLVWIQGTFASSLSEPGNRWGSRRNFIC